MPPIPAAAYQGLTTGASITPQNAGGVTSFIFWAVEFTESISGDMVRYFPGGGGAVSGTQSGPKGGSVTYQGYIVDSTQGWVTETFHNFAYVPTGATGTLTVNGELILGVQGGFATLGFSNYRAQGLGVDITYTGGATQTIVPEYYVNGAPNVVDTKLNLSVKNNSSGLTDEFSNFEVKMVGGPNDLGYFVDRTFAGRVYSSPYGYFDVSTTGAIKYSGDPSIFLPVSGADVLIHSTNADALTVGPLNTYFFSVGLATSPTAQPSSWARFNWSDFAIDETPTTDAVDPVAVAEIDTQPGVGFPITLDARFSHSTNGDYLTFQWSLLHVPPGSKAKISNATSPLASITLDVVGDYLVQLTAKDGSQTAVDTVVVSVPEQNAPTAASPQYISTAGPDQKANVGDTVMLDGRASFPAITGLGNPNFIWTLEAPAGSSATLSDAASPTPTFVPDVPGYYHVVLAGNGITISSLTVTVGESLAFYPAVSFDDGPNFFQPYTFGVADINSDGLPDVIMASPGYIISGDQGDVHIYLQASDGEFKTPQLLSGSSGDSFTVGDLNGDGRLDIVTGADTQVNAYLQATDGSFGTPQSLTFTALTGQVEPAPVAIANLFGSSSMSIAAFDGFTKLYEIPVDSSGVMQPPSGLTLSTGVISMDDISFADINNDGDVDLIGNSPGGPTIYKAQSGGTFSSLGIISPNPAAAGMLYGDGKYELVLAGSNSVTIEPESLSGTPFTVSNTLGVVQAIAFDDVEGLGRMDIVLLHNQCNGSASGCGFGFLYQQADTSFAPEVFFPIDSHPSGPLWVGDLNGDGIPDVMYVIGERSVVQFGYRP